MPWTWVRGFIGLITLYSTTPTYYSVITTNEHTSQRGEFPPQPPGAPTFVLHQSPHLQALPGKRK